MFGLRWRIDCTPRTKNGQPAQSTTGVASSSSTQFCVAPWNSASECPAIASRVTITVSGRVHQKRREKSRSSGFSCSSSSGITGSSAMPHLGQVPGPIWRISGCMGQVYSAPASASTGAAAAGSVPA
ncbi:hypothetical protein SSTU70S_02858 [Stutzerimonas stutzeri]